jgi:uncharacterized protein YaiL (DUF2058 family)
VLFHLIGRHRREFGQALSGQQSKIQEEWDMLAREEQLEKRLRQGRCSKKEYKAEMRKLHRMQGIAAEEDDILSEGEE